MNKLQELLHDFDLFKSSYKGYLTDKALENHLNLIAREVVEHLINASRAHPFAELHIQKDSVQLKKQEFQELCEMLNNLYSQQIAGLTGRAPMFSKQKAEDLKSGYADGVVSMGRHILAKLNIKLEE